MAAHHLYVHIPFCARRCSYCDFSIAVRTNTPVVEYTTALRQELDRRSQDLKDSTLETIYLGGGTPSRLGGPGISAVVGSIREHATVATDAEITIEANPDDINDVAVARWAAAGVNRVSLGAQSFDDSALKWMHRTHDSRQVGIAVDTLRRGGITNISLDLIFSLPTHLDRSWQADLERALALQPAHVSLYGLTVEERTPIARWAGRGAIVEGSEASYEEEFLAADSVMTAAGFDHYEVSNFARPGFVSRHNSAYWTGASYVGVGPSAHSFDGATRRWNFSAYSEWIRCLHQGRSVTAGEETLTSENRDAEKVYLGLRTSAGLTIDEARVDGLDAWLSAGWGSFVDGRLRLTATGWLRLDSLAADMVARKAHPSAAALGINPSHCYI